MEEFTNEEVRCAFKEVYYIIELLDEQIKEKIPKEKIMFYKAHMDNSHEFRYDLNKELNDQNILYSTKCILSNIFKEYVASEEDKKEILIKEQKELDYIDKQKRLKYNPNDIFEKDNNKKMAISSIEIEEVSTDLIVHKKSETIFEKIKNKILKFLKLR